jgi:purine nucleosidase
VIAYLLAPEAFSLRPCRIDVETMSTLTRGHTAVEFRKAVAGAFNASWVSKANPEAVLSFLLRYLA